MRALLSLARRAAAVAARQHAVQPAQQLQHDARGAQWRALCAAPAAKPSTPAEADAHIKTAPVAEAVSSDAAAAAAAPDVSVMDGGIAASAAEAGTTAAGATTNESPCGLSATDIYDMAANKATRYVYLRTVPLAKQDALSADDVTSLAGAIEAGARVVIARHLQRVVDERAAVHLHTTALAVATQRALTGVRLSRTEETGRERVENVVRAGFGAKLGHDPSLSEEENLLNAGDDGGMRPDFWIIRAALWFALDKMGAVSKMTENMMRDFGAGFECSTEDTTKDGMRRHVVRVHKCLYDEVCRAEGLPELTRVFCALDRAMYSPLNRSRVGVTFELQRTLADEADDGDGRRCEFKFEKSI